MNKFIFIIPVLAGLSTLLGIIPTYFKLNEVKIINFSRYMTIGILLIVIIFNLLPETYYYLNNIGLIVFFVLIGIFINYFISKKIILNNYLYRIGILSVIAITLHNIPEGIITAVTSITNYKLGITTSLAIMFHNIPEGISIAVPIYFATKSHKKAFIYTFISGFSEVFGVLMTILFLKNIINDFSLAIILSITIGIMLYLIFSLIKKEDYSS